MKTDQIIKELTFKTSRSSGAGGQHVNKVSSRVSLIFNLKNSLGLTQREKSIIISKMSSRITTDGLIILHSQVSRSQHRNKELAIRRFLNLLKTALAPVKRRIKTKPSKSSRESRLKSKKEHSLKKSLRRTPKF